MEDFKKEWDRRISVQDMGMPFVIAHTVPIYGIWNGTGWMRTGDGIFHQSVSPNALMAQMLDWNPEELKRMSVREIGPDGKPVEEAAVTP